MGLYERYVLPHAVRLSCNIKPIRRQREKIVPQAEGRVLEVGIGSGLNLPHYDAARVEKVWGLDPSAELRRYAEREARAVDFEVDFLGLSGDAIPLDDDSADTVVVTYTLCTIPDAVAALGEMRRVLRPGGKLLFSEHGAAPDAAVRRWQDRLTPVWKRFAGGCHLNRDIPALLRAGGFATEQLDSMYIPGWRPASFTYWGYARPD
ncbi:MAG: class I SAM-dependent methyltransferase [Alphaproteobacteria bacterium]